MTSTLRSATLTIRAEEGCVAKLEWRAGVTKVLFATATMQPATERWIEEGLAEWIGEREDSTPRMTASTSPEFLPRLEEYLARQFRFRMTCDKVIESRAVSLPSADLLERERWLAALEDAAYVIVPGAIDSTSSTALFMTGPLPEPDSVTGQIRFPSERQPENARLRKPFMDYRPAPRSLGPFRRAS